MRLALFTDRTILQARVIPPDPKSLYKRHRYADGLADRVMTGMDGEPSDEDRRAWSAELEHLRQEHRDLDAAIEALLHIGGMDRLQVQRLKKRELILRDRMAFLGDQLTPDISA